MWAKLHIFSLESLLFSFIRFASVHIRISSVSAHSSIFFPKFYRSRAAPCYFLFIPMLSFIMVLTLPKTLPSFHYFAWPLSQACVQNFHFIYQHSAPYFTVTNSNIPLLFNYRSPLASSYHQVLFFYRDPNSSNSSHIELLFPSTSFTKYPFHI